MTDWIQTLMQTLGYPGITLLMALENLIPPIPSELVMPLAGFTAARGELGLAAVVVAGTLGSVLGALPLYALGRVLGEARLLRWAERYGRWLGFSAKDVARASAWFARRGGVAVFFLRLVPGVRSLISIPAGIARMPLMQFVLLTTLGTGLWTALLTLAGYLLGENYAQVEHVLGPVSYGVLGALVLVGVGGLLWSGVRRGVRRGRVSNRDARDRSG